MAGAIRRQKKASNRPFPDGPNRARMKPSASEEAEMGSLIESLVGLVRPAATTAIEVSPDVDVLAAIAAGVAADRAAIARRIDALAGKLARDDCSAAEHAELRQLMLAGLVDEAALRAKVAVVKSFDEKVAAAALKLRKAQALRDQAAAGEERVRELERELRQTREAIRLHKERLGGALFAIRELQAEVAAHPGLFPAGTDPKALVEDLAARE